jgi:hypothetical protein
MKLPKIGNNFMKPLKTFMKVKNILTSRTNIIWQLTVNANLHFYMNILILNV